MARHKAKEIAIPTKFVPRFWDAEDGRSVVVKEIRRRVNELSDDAGVDSYQKEILVQRAVFMLLQLETMEIEAARHGNFDPGVYTQMTNSLLGLLKHVGLERKTPKTVDLEAYVSGKRK